MIILKNLYLKKLKKICLKKTNKLFNNKYKFFQYKKIGINYKKFIFISNFIIYKKI